MSRYSRLESALNDLTIDFNRFLHETNRAASSLARDYYNLTQGSESTASKRELLSDRHINDAKFIALEEAYNEILELLELKNIKIKTNCPECKQELPEDYNES
jgi:hypothetical protein